MGILAAVNIPKESSPAIKLGMISIVTSYPGTSPIDMDTLISDKIYKEVKDISGIDKIQSTSSLGISSLVLTLRTDADTKEVMNDVRNKIGRVALPSDAKSPSITEIETDTNRAFSTYIYAKSGEPSRAFLYARAIELQRAIEWVKWVDTVDLSAGWGGRPIDAGWGNNSTYEVRLIADRSKLETLGITLAQISGVIQSYNRDQPIGNYAIGQKKYDFRIEGKNKESLDFLQIPITLSNGASVRVWDLVTIERHYKDDSINRLIVWDSGSNGTGSMQSRPYVGITINKTDSASIFWASDGAKKVIESMFEKSEFQNLGYMYATDLADTIRDDYAELFKEAIITLVLVFVAMYLFVGFRDSIFATITLPLAFLATFLLLYYGGYTLNFLTNFSLILSFGIAIDTIIVIVQAASSKLRVGYEPKTAIMLALREYGIPVISGVMTTIVVFIPMMTLPGIMGKFLAFIPITIFGVLATGLVLALTVNSALYLLFVKRKQSYVDNPHATEYATEDEKELLILEREGKTRIEETRAPLRIRIIHSVTESYKWILRRFLENTFIRRMSILIPAILLVLSFIFLAPLIGFNLFPSDDNNIASITITGPVWQRTEVTAQALSGIDQTFIGYPEIKHISMSISRNIATIDIQLTKRQERKAKKERSIFELEQVFLEKLSRFERKGYRVVSAVQKNGPPGSKAIGLKLIAENAEKLPELIHVSKAFESYLKTIPGTKNVGKSSEDTPGQFIFSLKKEEIAAAGISPALIYSQIAQSMNGITVWSIEDNGEDMNIVLKSSQFIEEVRPEDIQNIPLTVGATTYRIGDFINTKITNATASVSREDGKIQITVDADLEAGVDSVSVGKQFETFATKYTFPTGISYAKWGENEENSELIIAILSAFFIAIIVIFAILTLQFNSFSQPLVIIYSVVMSLPLVMVGLYITDNPFSLSFGIGFIAFTGIAVNHGIILIDAINQNLKKGMTGFTALIEAGSSRLEPMALTTFTTVLGILPIALRDKFWSGMGFTIIFGIIAASTLTLFVVKWIYYEIYLNTDESFLTRWRRNIQKILSISYWKKRKKV